MQDNIVMITIKHLQINPISSLNNPYRVDMPLNKYTKPSVLVYMLT